MKKTESAGGIVLNDKEQVIVVNQKGTSWSLPKGHIEQGEDALTAARREIYEETGVSRLQLVEELGSYQRVKLGANGEDDASELKTIFMFLFTTDETELRPNDPDNPEAVWLDKEQVAALLTHPKDKKFFKRHSKDIEGNAYVS